jgi:hypothetical protein
LYISATRAPFCCISLESFIKGLDISTVITDLVSQMSYLRTVHQQSTVLAALSALVSLILLASFAACLTCDMGDDSCCEEAEHEDEEVCACGCALHALTMAANTPARALEVGNPFAESAQSVDPVPAFPPFHPPRLAG